MSRRQSRSLQGLFAAVVFLSLLFPCAASAGSGSLVGTAISPEDYSPIPGLEILLQSESDAFTTVSGETGEYSFFDLPAGEYTLSVNDSQYIPIDIQVVIGDGQALDLDLAPALLDEALQPLALYSEQASRSRDMQPLAITGKWSGAWRDSDGDTGPLSMTVKQTGSKIKGSLTVGNTPCGKVTMPYSGALKGSKASLKGASKCMGYSVALEVLGTVKGTRITGDFRLLVGGAIYSTGTYTLKKR